MVSLTLDSSADVINLGLGFDQISVYQALAGDLALTIGPTTAVTIGGVMVSTWIGFEQATISSGAGNDTIITAAGNGRIYAYSGADMVQIMGGNDFISMTLDALTDTIDGGLGNDMLSVYGDASAYQADLATPGIMLIKQGAVTNAQVTGAEHLVLCGGYDVSANDMLTGLGGADALIGNAGKARWTAAPEMTASWLKWGSIG